MPDLKAEKVNQGQAGLNPRRSLKTPTGYLALPNRATLADVGDNHDKGGNRTQVRFYDRGTNMHRLWDSDMIEREGDGEDFWLADLPRWTPRRTGYPWGRYPWGQTDLEFSPQEILNRSDRGSLTPRLPDPEAP